MKELLNKIWTEENNNKVVTALYRMGLFVFVPLIILFFFLRTDFATSLLIKDSVSCFFRRNTGLYCSGCGGTRASLLLARLHIIESIRMNCIVVSGVAMYIYFMIKETLHRLVGTKGATERELTWLVVAFAVLSLGRCLIINIMLVMG